MMSSFLPLLLSFSPLYSPVLPAPLFSVVNALNSSTIMAQAIPENISFENAIAQTQELVEKMANQSISDTEVEKTITNLVKTENGARGFFVTYLTDERPFVDSPSPSLIRALQSSPDIVGELLVKNLAMSSATAVAHRRNQDEAMAKGSEQVRDRTLYLIKATNLPVVNTKLQSLESTLKNGQGQYQAFIERWGYDDEQK
ncbi:MAG: hypothetical protein VKJ02_05850, partial [Snowella sp.]|nr:hypothetical protein [Snowella sp.]